MLVSTRCKVVSGLTGLVAGESVDSTGTSMDVTVMGDSVCSGSSAESLVAQFDTTNRAAKSAPKERVDLLCSIK